MELSIIVVNYNVRYFLQVCLESLKSAARTVPSEIIVVDNASSDDSVDMLKRSFPDIKLISNDVNMGFGRACNQALAISRGRFVLFVNPDTVMGESLIPDALQIFNRDANIGAVGVCLLDGNGKILRESKRSIPSLWSAFTKFSGLSDVFRHSALFNQYYAPELDYGDSGNIEVLPGAFMLIRRHVLDELKGFDPRFFMYAEDIDLSYRITRAGYSIWYEGSLHVIHFKGESTQKSLTTYTNTFFHSMQLFIRKYTGELYGSAVARILQTIVGTIQGVQSVRKRFFPSGNSGGKRKMNRAVFLLSNEDNLRSNMERYLGADRVHAIPDHGTDGAEVYLRYIPSWQEIHPETSMMLDFRSLSFDQIVHLWKMERKGPVFLADSKNSFFIGSHNKEKQGEVHTFG